MLTAKKNSNDVDLSYTVGDTFKFAISADEGLEAGSVIRFQISQLGGEYDLIIDKTFKVEQQPVIISLTPSEAKKLKEDKTYNYRLTLIDTNSSVITKISGDIDVKWGA